MSSGKFAALKGQATLPSRMIIIDPITEKPIVDKQGNEAFIDMLGPDSDQALKIDRANNTAAVRKMRSGRNRQNPEDEDFIKDQVEKLSAVTVAWYLIDPATQEPLDVPFSKENASELYADRDLGWLRRQAWGHHNAEANFIMRSSKSSASSPSGASASIGNETTEQPKATT